MFMFTFVSCNSSDGSDVTSDNTTDTQTTEAPPVVTPPAEITLAQLRDDYELIRADAASADVKSAFSSLMAMIQEEYGFLPEASDDFFREGIPALAKGQFEILVGDTNREEGKEFLASLKWQDYGYGMVGDKLVIAGKSDEATIKAVNLFMENFKKKDRSEVFYNDSEKVLCYETYTAQTLKINGVDAADMSIVVKSKKGIEYMVAVKLQSLICELSGYHPEILLETEASSGSPMFIIGESSLVPADMQAKWATETGDKFYMTSNDNVIWSTAKDLEGYASITAEIKQLITGEGNVEVVIEDGFRATNHIESVSVMSFNIYTHTGDSERVERVIEMILKYQPDVLGVQEASVSWMNILKDRIGTLYGFVGEGRNGGNSGEYSAIFYLKDKFKVHDSGTKWLSSTPDVAGSKYSTSSYPRIMTYAVLERKIDGLQFLHVNTHLEHTNEESRLSQISVLLKQIEMLPDLPTTITGDFNCSTSSSVYKNILNSGYSDVSKVAESATTGPTFHNYGSSSSLIDFIFASSDIYVEKYNVCNEMINGNYASDHHPIFSIIGIIG